MSQPSNQGVLENKIALITGAGSGIGAASALRFSEAGATVVVCDIDAQQAAAGAASSAPPRAPEFALPANWESTG